MTRNEDVSPLKSQSCQASFDATLTGCHVKQQLLSSACARLCLCTVVIE